MFKRIPLSLSLAPWFLIFLASNFPVVTVALSLLTLILTLKTPGGQLSCGVIDGSALEFFCAF